MNLSDLHPNRGSRKSRFRVGRGQGSGAGCTSGKGNKGQKSRSGGVKGPGFEGGQMPLQRRLPKKGFVNIFRVPYVSVNLGQIAEITSDTVDPETMINSGLIQKVKGKGIKVLAYGDFSVAKTVKAHAFSKAAIAKIEAANGKAVIIADRADSAGMES